MRKKDPTPQDLTAKIAISEEKYRSLFQQHSLGIFIHDLNGKILDVNPVACKQLGYSKQELLKLNIFDLHPAEVSINLAKKEILRQWKKWLPGNNHTIFAEHQCKDGKILSVQINSSALKYAEENQILAIVQDITKNKKTEEALKKSEAKLSQAMQIAKLGYWEYNAADDLFTFNDQFYSIFHTTAEQAGGYKMTPSQYAETFMHPEDRQLVAEEMKKVMETNDPNFNQQLEHRIIYADGEVGYISVQYFIVKDENGRTIKTYGVNQDITERKEIEIELQKYREDLEALVEERTKELEEKNKELEEFNSLFIGREYRIKELKDKVKELEEKLKQSN